RNRGPLTCFSFGNPRVPCRQLGSHAISREEPGAEGTRRSGRDRRFGVVCPVRGRDALSQGRRSQEKPSLESLRWIIIGSSGRTLGHPVSSVVRRLTVDYRGISPPRERAQTAPASLGLTVAVASSCLPVAGRHTFKRLESNR